MTEPQEMSSWYHLRLNAMANGHPAWAFNGAIFLGIWGNPFDTHKATKLSSKNPPRNPRNSPASRLPKDLQCHLVSWLDHLACDLGPDWPILGHFADWLPSWPISNLWLACDDDAAADDDAADGGDDTAADDAADDDAADDHDAAVGDDGKNICSQVASAI